MKRPAVIIGLWLLLALPALAQQGEDRFADYAQLLSPEKVYLHTDREVYNLAGQRVAQPTKGLYIVNGKKVVIK